MPKQRLELTWIGKENRPRLEPRILIEDPAKSHHAPHRVSENDIFENKLILGDNLLALKALEAEYTGKVKCVFIDPPYNTGSAFTHYDVRESCTNQKPDWLSPPGETILDVLEERGWSLADFAERMNYSPKHVNLLVKGKAGITEETALKLERVLGSTASFWLDREAHYRKALARGSS